MTATTLLQVTELTKVFGSGRTEVRAVSGVDLVTDRGEITLVMGPSGSGKTTLLTMIGCLLRPTAGTVEIDGVDVTALPTRELPRIRRTLVGFVFQTFNLLDALSAQENVEVALNIAGVKGPEAAGRARCSWRPAWQGASTFRPRVSPPASASESRSRGHSQTTRPPPRRRADGEPRLPART